MGLFTKDKNFYRRFFALTFTIALQNVIVFAVNLADNVMLGAYSEPSLSGVALVNQIQFFLQMVVMGVGEGIVVLSSRCWGRKDMEPIRKIVNIGLKFGIVFAVILWACLLYTSNRHHSEWRADLDVFTDIKIPQAYFLDTIKKQAVVNPGVLFEFVDHTPDGVQTVSYTHLL